MRLSVAFLALAVMLFAVATVAQAKSKPAPSEDHIEQLLRLRKLLDLEIIDEAEFEERRVAMIDAYLGVNQKPNSAFDVDPNKKTFTDYKRVFDYNSRHGGKRQVPDPSDGDGNWTMPVVFTPEIDWLLSVFKDNMPRSYNDVIPYTSQLYWKSHLYLADGARDYNGTRLRFWDIEAIQERALTHVGLNIYDGGVWSISLALAGLSDFVDIYTRNVLLTSSTGANVAVGGLKSIRAWEPNPDPESPPDPFYYGKDQITNENIGQVTMPANLTFIRFMDGCECASAGCCPQEGLNEIPGNFFYRMIGPKFILDDPLQGVYGDVWRAEPFGPNPDPAQSWNAAGIAHWNDWKPITGENVWAGILAPLQVDFIRNCSNVMDFSSFEEAPHSVQLAVSLLKASDALLSPLGSMYHCPEGTKMYPPDPDEATNVSNENNFSAWAAYKALQWFLQEYYTGGDPVLDEAKEINDRLVQGLDDWFAKYLMPNKLVGEDVISQGGHVSFMGDYEPQDGDQGFAVDCQTWGLLVEGAKRFDASYGSKTTAYEVWQATKKLAGFYVNGELAGVGYTIPNGYNGTAYQGDVWSGEWSWGAVFMARKLSMEYATFGKTQWANDLMADVDSMVKHLTMEVNPGPDGLWTPGGGLKQIDGSYLYANARFFIPWGWYSNPIAATASTGWAQFYAYKYNPFELGGGRNSTFYDDQCQDNPPPSDLLEKLEKFYDYY
eukprot:TRINITY_DN6932_c0_g1_i1.p1 TRINITY_DN6932_c0_g1~~TRINITY_DN6932_c0_g1_i1.p1  ORF type:complete len:719 (-),score=179.21 TRINITY_DN6932_c0_g1_i1:81-2237(-)